MDLAVELAFLKYRRIVVMHPPWLTRLMEVVDE